MSAGAWEMKKSQSTGQKHGTFRARDVRNPRHFSTTPVTLLGGGLIFAVVAALIWAHVAAPVISTTALVALALVVIAAIGTARRTTRDAEPTLASAE